MVEGGCIIVIETGFVPLIGNFTPSTSYLPGFPRCCRSWIALHAPVFSTTTSSLNVTPLTFSTATAILPPTRRKSRSVIVSPTSTRNTFQLFLTLSLRAQLNQVHDTALLALGSDPCNHQDDGEGGEDEAESAEGRGVDGVHLELEARDQVRPFLCIFGPLILFFSVVPFLLILDQLWYFERTSLRRLSRLSNLCTDILS